MPEWHLGLENSCSPSFVRRNDLLYEVVFAENIIHIAPSLDCMFIGRWGGTAGLLFGFIVLSVFHDLEVTFCGL